MTYNTLLSAVAIFSILKSRKGSFTPSTVIIEQYRPPVDKFVVGPCLFTHSSKCLPDNYAQKNFLRVMVYFPSTGIRVTEEVAGLVDKGESPEQTAIRELREETGFEADSVDGIIESSPLLATDPGK